MAPDRGRESREKAEKPQKSEISTYNNWSDVLYVAHEAGIADATLLDCIRRNLLGPIAAERARRQQERNCREMPNAIRPHPEASREAPSIADHIPPHILEHVVATGDLAKLTPQDRLTYYLARCHAARLDPRTVPFQYLTLDGKLVLYATKAAVDQLIAGRRITVEITEKKLDRNYGVFKVQCRATLPGGSWVDDIGLVPVDGLRGNAFCNTIMKCVPLDSEILTRDGWRTQDRLAVGDLVLGYNPEADRTEWTVVEAVHVYGLSPMGVLRTTNGRFSVRCTPGHRWAVGKRAYQPQPIDGSRGPKGPYRNRGADRQIVTVEELIAITGRRLILAAREAAGGDSPLSPIEASILGWAVTDGSIKRVGNSVRIGVCQSKEQNFEAIRAVMADAVGGVTEVVSEPGVRTFPSGKTYETRPQHWWYLPAGFSRSLLERAGFRDRGDLAAIATRLSPRARTAMLQAFMLAEGDRKGRFYNTDPDIFDAFHVLCALEGAAVGGRYSRSQPGATRPCLYQQVLGRRQIATQNLRFEPSALEPSWCPTTALGSWVMRQDGRVMITGNCVTKAKRRAVLSACGLGMMDETEVETIPGAEVVPTAEVMPSIGKPPAGEPAVGSHREPRAERRRRPPPRPSPPRRPEPEDLSQEGEFAAEDLADDDWEEGRE